MDGSSILAEEPTDFGIDPQIRKSKSKSRPKSNPHRDQTRIKKKDQKDKKKHDEFENDRCPCLGPSPPPRPPPGIDVCCVDPMGTNHLVQPTIRTSTNPPPPTRTFRRRPERRPAGSIAHLLPLAAPARPWRTPWGPCSASAPGSGPRRDPRHAPAPGRAGAWQVVWLRLAIAC